MAATAVVAYPAEAETTFRPYVESRIVASSRDLLDLSNYRTWLEPAAGFNANLDSQRVNGALNYRVARRYGIGSTINDKVRHNGSGSVRAELLRDYLFLNTQGYASIIGSNFGGIINPDSDDAGDQQVYGGSVQPTFAHTFANRIRVNANYRYSIFEVEGGVPPLQIGQPFRLDRPSFSGASDQRSQSATASIANRGASDRIRLELRGEWLKDRIEQLNEHYDSKRVLLDGEVALTRTVSIVGSGGYEDVRDELDSLLVDVQTGLPILDTQGLLQRDPTMPRRVNFDFTGPSWDIGVRLTPSPRAGLTVRGGQRYDSFSGSASIYYQIGADVTVSGAYQDSINNFGRLFTTLYSDPVTGRITPVGTRAGGSSSRRGGTPLGAGGCAFGFDPETQFCRFNLTQISSSAVFRERTGSLTLTKGSDDFSTGSRFYGYATAFYTRRNYLGESQLFPPAQLAFVPALYLAGTRDISFGASSRAERLLGGNRYVTLDLQALRNVYALSSDSRDVYLSARAEYDMLLDRRINLFATAFLARRFAERNASSFYFSRVGPSDFTQATFSIGVRYLFSPFRGRFTPAENERSRQ